MCVHSFSCACSRGLELPCTVQKGVTFFYSNGIKLPGTTGFVCKTSGLLSVVHEPVPSCQLVNKLPIATGHSKSYTRVQVRESRLCLAATLCFKKRETHRELRMYVRCISTGRSPCMWHAHLRRATDLTFIVRRLFIAPPPRLLFMTMSRATKTQKPTANDYTTAVDT